MFLKVSQKKSVTAEYHPINSVVSITTIEDEEFDTSEVVAKVRFNNDAITIYKHQNAWLVNSEGKVLEVINRDYMWS
ncbi:hypothetical protein [Enterobacter ludwigii]|uniref:hypothetical protein n=1 Tax=Enterobacter ludwigii TaxID=299767 RepID=UPI002FFBECA2